MSKPKIPHKAKAKAKPKTPKDEGHEAYLNGITECPYNPLSKANKAWENGWWQACNEEELEQ